MRRPSTKYDSYGRSASNVQRIGQNQARELTPSAGTLHWRTMCRAPVLCLFGFVLCTASVATPSGVRAQTPASTAVPEDQIARYAKAYTSIALLRDQVQAEFAEPKNTKDEPQRYLREKLRNGIARILLDLKLTDVQYERITFQVSTDPDRRKAFDDALAQLASRKKEP